MTREWKCGKAFPATEPPCGQSHVAAGTPPQPWNRWPGKMDRRYVLPLLALLTMLLAWMLRRPPQPRWRLARAVPALLLVALLVGMAACASGPETELRRGLVGTLPGTYTITVNGNTSSTGAPLTQSTAVTLIVRQQGSGKVAEWKSGRTQNAERRNQKQKAED